MNLLLLLFHDCYSSYILFSDILFLSYFRSIMSTGIIFKDLSNVAHRKLEDDFSLVIVWSFLNDPMPIWMWFYDYLIGCLTVLWLYMFSFRLFSSVSYHVTLRFMWHHVLYGIRCFMTTQNYSCSHTCMNLGISMHWKELEDVGVGFSIRRNKRIKNIMEWLQVTNHNLISILILIKMILFPQMTSRDTQEVMVVHTISSENSYS